jgi:hypothetical protein
MHTNIHDLSGIRTNDPGVRAGEDNSSLRPRGHCGRLKLNDCTNHKSKPFFPQQVLRRTRHRVTWQSAMGFALCSLVACFRVYVLSCGFFSV